jgi:hypothetical protein
MSEQQKNPHAVALGRLGGGAATEAQAAASRRNGKKGGRPRTKKGPYAGTRGTARGGDDRP